MKHPLDLITRQYRSTLIWLSALFICAFILILLLLVGATKAMNEESHAHIQASIQEHLNQARSDILSQVIDYAVWDEAFKQWVTQEQPDNRWIISNLSDSLYENLSIDWAFVTQHQDKILLSHYQGKPRPPSTDTRETILSLDNGTQFVQVGQEILLAASYPVLPESGAVMRDDFGIHFIFAYDFAKNSLPALRAYTQLPDLNINLSKQADKNHFALKNQTGEILAYLSWTPPQPGSQLLKTVFPWIFLLLIVIGSGVFFFLHQLLRQGQYSIREMQVLADTRQALDNQQAVIQMLRATFEQQTSQNDFFNTLSVSSAKLIRSDITSVWLLDNLHNQMVCEASNSTMKDERLDRSDIRFCLELLQKQPVLALNLENSLQQVDTTSDETTMRNFFKDHGVQSLMVTGIYLGGELRGALTFCSYRDNTWSDAEKNACSALAGVIAQFAETFRRRQAEADFYKETHFDPATGLPKLAYIRDLFANREHHLQGYLCIIRVQGLHIINEFHGYEAGNSIFRSMAEMLLQALDNYKGESLLVRLPANRLGLFIEGIASDVQTTLNRLLQQVEDKPWNYQRQSYTLSLQAGLAHYPDDGQDLELLQHRAKLALQHVRNHPESPVAFYSRQVSYSLKSHSEAIRELQMAIYNEEFVLFFQPQFDTTGSIHSAEALVRWQHPKRGLLSPAHFISLAEETELILPLGQWILQEACQILSQLPISLSVNISVLQLRQKSFIQEIKQLITRFDLKPGQLVLEIVESLMVEPWINRKLTELRTLGVEISLDDFGTGYSSLSYLQEMQLDELKVDQSFVRTLEHQNDAPLVRTIIAMAHTLNMRVVIEGVETQHQLEFVQKHGAELIQGYLLAKPMPEKAFIARIQQSQL